MAVEFKATADYNAVVTELDKVRRANEALIAKQGEMKKGANEAEKAQVSALRELERFAVQTGRSVQTANERHQQQLEKLKKAFDANLLTAEQYGRAVQKANEDAANSYDVVAEKVEQVDDKQEQATKSTEGLGAAVGTAVLGYLSFQAILSKVGEALKWTREQTEAAMSSFSGLSDERRALSQIADREGGVSLDELEDTVDRLASTYGERRADVAQAVFAAYSEGFQDDLESIVKYGDVVKLQAASTVAGQVPGLFKDIDISPMQAIGATLAAARESRLDFEKMAAAMPIISQGAEMSGATPSEAMAVLGVLSSRFTTGEQTANVFRGMGTQLSVAGGELGGKGLIGGVETLMGMDEETRRDFLQKNMELNTAYNILSQSIPEVRQRMAELDEEMKVVGEGGAGILERRYQEHFDPSTERGQLRIAAEANRQAIIEDEISRERNMALRGFQTSTARAESREGMRDEATFAQFAVDRMTGLAEFGDFSERGVTAVAGAGQRGFGGTQGNLEFLSRGFRDVTEGGIPFLERMITGQEGPSWLPNWARTGVGAAQAGAQWARGGEEGELLREQQRANAEAETQTQILREIANAGPRSGMSTLTQPQMNSQTIPR